MGEDNKKASIIECSLNYSLKDKTGEEIESGKATTQISKEKLSLTTDFGDSMFISLRDILRFAEGEYRIHLSLNSKQKLTLFNLGYRYDDFLRVLVKLHNELIMKDMLMEESIRKSGIEMAFEHLDEVGIVLLKGKGELRLYDTAIVLLPYRAEPIRIPYSLLSGVSEEDYTLVLNTESGEKIILSKLGKEFDPVKDNLSKIMNELSLKVQSSLKELIPDADPSIIRRLSRFMKEGKAAKRSDIESVSPKLWGELEKHLELAGIKEEYNSLKSLSQQEKLCIGLKRGLLGDLTGEYIWFLIPIYNTNPKEPGNAVAMEATGEEGKGKATYFFRITSRKDYPALEDLEELHKKTDSFIKEINYCMLAINFRRAPIYLPEEQLSEARYQKYIFAINRIPSLQTLRNHFIGRVIHYNPSQWKEDVMDLLKFNVVARDDKLRWKKSKNQG